MPESTVACPHCQQSIRVMTEHAGNQVACPFCQNAMVVPEFEDAAAGTNAANAESASVAENRLTDTAFTFACSHCVQPFQVSGDSLGQAVSCPSCGNAVQIPDTPTTSVPESKPRPKPRPRPRLRPKRESKPAPEPAVKPVEAAANWERGPAASPQSTIEAPRSPIGKNRPVLISPEKAALAKRNGNAPFGMDGADLLPPKFEALLPRMSDIALSADGKAVASMSFQEPVKTIRVNGNERVLRRLSPEEKITRRRQRNAVLFLMGMLFLGVTVAILIRR